MSSQEAPARDGIEPPTMSQSPHLGTNTSQTKDEAYHRVPNKEDEASAGYPSPAFSSPGWTTSSFSPTSAPFKDLEEVRRFNEMRENDTILKRKIRRLKFVLRLMTLALGLYMIITMSVTLQKFFSTRNTMVEVPNPANPPGGDEPTIRRGPWAKQSKTWPTTVLLTTSTLSFTMSAVVMAAYIRGTRAANTASEYGSYLGAAIVAAHAGLWIAVAVAYRAGMDSTDLWGWTCDEGAERIQGPFDGVINFRRYCDLQTSSWAASLAEAVLVVLYVAVYAYGYRRLKGQREIGTRFEHVYEYKESRWTRWIPGRRTARP